MYAEFKRVADNKAETGDGDSECASGSQKCTGASPILVPNPNNINIKESFSQKILKNWAFLDNSV